MSKFDEEVQQAEIVYLKGKQLMSGIRAIQEEVYGINGMDVYTKAYAKCRALLDKTEDVRMYDIGLANEVYAIRKAEEIAILEAKLRSLMQ